MAEEKEMIGAEWKSRNEKNELYQKSCSVHKGYQLARMMDGNGNPCEGQESRLEDKYGIPDFMEGFDSSSARIVLYNFENGLISASDGSPAIEYAGHQEYWKDGLIQELPQILETSMKYGKKAFL